VNRIGASRLAQIAAALDIPIPSLFEGVERRHVNHVSSPQELLADANAGSQKPSPRYAILESDERSWNSSLKWPIKWKWLQKRVVTTS